MTPTHDENEKTADVDRRPVDGQLTAKDEGQLPEKDGWRFIRRLKRSRFSEPRNQPYRAGWGPFVTGAVILPTIIIFALHKISGDKSEASSVPVSNASGTLSDGTPMHADPGTIWWERFSDERRHVHLYKGRALFDVDGDIKRPLVIATSKIDMAAVDARFVVTVKDFVELYVYRGTVEVSRHGAKKGAPTIKVNRGESYRTPGGLRALFVEGGNCDKGGMLASMPDGGDPEHPCDVGGLVAVIPRERLGQV